MDEGMPSQQKPPRKFAIEFASWESAECISIAFKNRDKDMPSQKKPPSKFAIEFASWVIMHGGEDAPTLDS
ncbi:hypothetical protein CDAR_535411 [Caerostris darwini]|uniref:Uncharacterized protein n=1 Tax=Caerostris darwini TaxID=1538125 RepID=A0AAV4V229_9ARAC|nr:hypothetical protein CDAR_535411 [Caerostris darwini]